MSETNRSDAIRGSVVCYHTMEYPDGTFFKGTVDHRFNINLIGLKDVEGLRVLDIATNDGFFAFWAEQHGASEVVAIDVGSYEGYDWGPNGPPDGIENLKQQDKWAIFDYHHANLKSKVKKREMSVYEIDRLGEFDVIFNFGLIYHLRHPLLALDLCRKACRGYTIVETASSTIDRYLPVSIEMGTHTGVGEVTDTFLPSDSSVASWMRKAAFPRTFLVGKKPSKRTICIGMVDEKYEDMFSMHEECDGFFWDRVVQTVREIAPTQP